MRAVITTLDLAALLEADPPARPAVLDIRWRLGGPPGIESYREGHLPGAVFVDLDTELSDPDGTGGRHPLPSPDALQRTLRAAGVNEGQPVVVYDDAGGASAARGWWLLRWAGHREVAVLDGGFAAWQAEGRPVTAEQARPAGGDIEVRPGGMPVLDATDAAAVARKGVLLDARVEERYTGATEPVDRRPGHIPGARNAPFTALTGDGGRWHSPGELAEHFAALGVREGTPVGAYCGSGVTASAVVLALEVAGHSEPVALYPGSWSEWVEDPSRPAVIGDQPG